LFLFAYSNKEETMASIIRELRNYKNNLSEKIDASRRHSLGGGPADALSSAAGQSPSLASLPDSHLPVGVSGSCVPSPTSSTKSADDGASHSAASFFQFAGRDPSALVSSAFGLHRAASIPPETSSSSGSRRSCGASGSASRYQARRRTQQQQQQQQYKLDEHGALDLSSSSTVAMPARVKAPVGPTAATANAGTDGVLDLRVSKSAAASELPAKKCVGAGVGSVPWPAGSFFSASSLQKMLVWTTGDVVDFASRVPGCRSYAEASNKSSCACKCTNDLS
jgi:hypothetical protein